MVAIRPHTVRRTFTNFAKSVNVVLRRGFILYRNTDFVDTRGVRYTGILGDVRVFSSRFLFQRLCYTTHRHQNGGRQRRFQHWTCHSQGHGRYHFPPITFNMAISGRRRQDRRRRGTGRRRASTTSPLLGNVQLTFLLAGAPHRLAGPNVNSYDGRRYLYHTTRRNNTRGARNIALRQVTILQLTDNDDFFCKRELANWQHLDSRRVPHLRSAWVYQSRVSHHRFCGVTKRRLISQSLRPTVFTFIIGCTRRHHNVTSRHFRNVYHFDKAYFLGGIRRHEGDSR